MAQFKAFRPGVEVYGAVVLSVVDGMGDFKTRAEGILAQHGIRRPQPEGWYPQQAWLDSFETIAEKIGPRTLFAIGKKILEAVEWPDWINSLATGMAASDLNYHLRHRLNGQRSAFSPAPIPAPGAPSAPPVPRHAPDPRPALRWTVRSGD